LGHGGRQTFLAVTAYTLGNSAQINNQNITSSLLLCSLFRRNNVLIRVPAPSRHKLFSTSSKKKFKKKLELKWQLALTGLGSASHSFGFDHAESCAQMRSTLSGYLSARPALFFQPAERLNLGAGFIL
jgi:hypothetical protein